MKKSAFALIVVLISGLAESNTAVGIGYIATLLHPAAYSDSQAAGIATGSQAGFGTTGGQSHALLWSGTASSMIDLNPAGLDYSAALGVFGNNQVGYGSNYHALLWHGTAASVVDLNPAGFGASRAYAASGTSQVGSGNLGDASHALLWHGTAASVVDLHPDGIFTMSVAYGAADGTQVGSGQTVPVGAFHALLWHDTAASAVDLHSPGYGSTYAVGVSGDSQVGYGDNGRPTALLWHGTAASAISLGPAGFLNSEALGVSSAGQVGWASYETPADPDPITTTHAMLWHDTAASAIDLHPYVLGLNPLFANSEALGISDDGSIVGFAYEPDGASYAVLWTPVPEPHSPILCAITAIAVTMYRRSR